MAQWYSLGTVQVTDDWQSFPNFAIDSQTFRAIQQFSIYPLRYCQIAQYFAGPGEGGLCSPIRRLYPSNQPFIFTLPIPSELYTQGFNTRDIMIRRPLPAYDAAQSVEIQVLY